jgi:hypothetical protein
MEYLLIFLVNCIYIPSFWFGVISDDAATVKMTPWCIFPLKPRRVFSILLHTVIACYIYFVFKSLPAAILFSVHPLSVQVPIWLAGRQYGINALIFLLSAAFVPWGVLFYLFGLIETRGIPTLMLTPLAFIGTHYWFIALAVFPIVYIQLKAVKRSIKDKTRKDGPFAYVQPESFTLHKFKKRNLIIVVKTFGYYALACLLPIKNGFYNSFLASYGHGEVDTEYWYSLNRHFWGGVGAILSMFVVWSFNAHNSIGMGIMLFVLSILPFLNFVTIQQAVAPRYIYLSLAGYLVALCGLADKLPVVFTALVYGGLFSFYLTKLLDVFKVYRKNSNVGIDVESHIFSENPRMWYYKIEYYLVHNNPIMAFAEASYGLRYSPKDCQLWFGLATASYKMGDIEAAKMALKKAEEFMILMGREEMRAHLETFRQQIEKDEKEKTK